MRAELLPPLSPRRTVSGTGRHVDLPLGLSLRRATEPGPRPSRVSNPSQAHDARVEYATADDKSVELSARRTGMSFQRTRMSADRTLMSVIRTSLSLIGFGFTIFQVFQQLHKAGVLADAHAPRRFGEALVAIGVAMLVAGIWYHVRFMLGLRHERHVLVSQGLIHGTSRFPASLVLIVAVVLLALGILAIVNMIFETGPLG